MKTDGNPMQRAHNAPRCTARSKRTGFPCKSPAVKGWTVCRMHGAGGGANPGSDHPNYRHGMRSEELKVVRAMTRLLAKYRPAN